MSNVGCAQCVRNRPCDDCSKVLAHFKIGTGELWRKIDERDKANARKRVRKQAPQAEPPAPDSMISRLAVQKAPLLNCGDNQPFLHGLTAGAQKRPRVHMAPWPMAFPKWMPLRNCGPANVMPARAVVGGNHFAPHDAQLGQPLREHCNYPRQPHSLPVSYTHLTLPTKRIV